MAHVNLALINPQTVCVFSGLAAISFNSGKDNRYDNNPINEKPGLNLTPLFSVHVCGMLNVAIVKQF